MTRNLRKSRVLESLHRKKDPLESERVRTSMMLAARISIALKSKGWNRLQLAEALGKQPSIITRWLSGTHNFTSDTLSDIQTVLGVQLLVRSDEELKISVTRYSLSVSVAQLPHLDRENLRLIAEMEGQNIESLQFGIVRIKDINFTIHEDRLSPDPAKMVKIEFQNTFGFSTENNLVIFTLRVYFHYDDQPPEVTLVDTSVQNVFAVENLKNYLVNNTSLDLPRDLLKTLVSLTISHTRAITSKNLAGTPMQNLFLPVVNLEEVTRHFFPDHFSVLEVAKKA